MMALVCTASSDKMMSARPLVSTSTEHMSSAELFLKEVGSLGFSSFLGITPFLYGLKDLFTLIKISDKVVRDC